MFFKFDIIKSVTFFRKILSLHLIKLKNNGIVIKGDNKFLTAMNSSGGGGWAAAIGPAATNIANAFTDTESSTAERVAGAMGIAALAKQWTADTSKGDAKLKEMQNNLISSAKPNYIQDASSTWGANNAVKLNSKSIISPISSVSGLPSLKDFKGNWWRNMGASVVQGAASGSVGGPWGALGGAVTGLLGSIGGLFGRTGRAQKAYDDFLAKRRTLMSAQQSAFDKAVKDQTLSNMQALANGNTQQRINDMANIRAYGGNLYNIKDMGGNLYTDLSPNMMSLWNSKQQIDQQKVNMQQMNFGLGNSFNQKINRFDGGGWFDLLFGNGTMQTPTPIQGVTESSYTPAIPYSTLSELRRRSYLLQQAIENARRSREADVEFWDRYRNDWGDRTPEYANMSEKEFLQESEGLHDNPDITGLPLSEYNRYKYRKYLSYPNNKTFGNAYLFRPSIDELRKKYPLEDLPVYKKGNSWYLKEGVPAINGYKNLENGGHKIRPEDFQDTIDELRRRAWDNEFYDYRYDTGEDLPNSIQFEGNPDTYHMQDNGKYMNDKGEYWDAGSYDDIRYLMSDGRAYDPSVGNTVKQQKREQYLKYKKEQEERAKKREEEGHVNDYWHKDIDDSFMSNPVVEHDEIIVKGDKSKKSDNVEYRPTQRQIGYKKLSEDLGGSEGVKHFQEQYNAYHPESRIKVDGKVGDETVRAFQSWNNEYGSDNVYGLNKLDVDGIYGEKSQEFMSSGIAKRNLEFAYGGNLFANGGVMPPNRPLTKEEIDKLTPAEKDEYIKKQAIRLYKELAAPSPALYNSREEDTEHTYNVLNRPDQNPYSSFNVFGNLFKPSNSGYIFSERDKRNEAAEKAQQHSGGSGGWGDVYANGGQLNSSDLPDNAQYYANGGTHEENPYGGIQVGVDQQGNPNLVEEGEFRWGDYIFSDRINVDPTLLSRYNLAPATRHQNKKANKGKLSYADMAKKYAKKNGELANDPIGKNTLEAYMKRLQDAQEDQKFQDSMEQQKQDAINQYRKTLSTPQQGNPMYGAMKYNGMGNAATQQGVNAGMSNLGQQGSGNEVLSNTNRSGNNMLHAFGGNLFWDGGTPQIKPNLLNVNPNLVLGDDYMNSWTANNAGTPRLFSSTTPMYTGENPEANFTAYQKRYPTLPSDAKGMQQLLVNEGFDIGNTGPNKDGVDGIWGNKSQAAWYDFLRAYNHRPNTINQYDLIGSNNQPSTSNVQASENGVLNLGVRDGDATTDANNLGDGQTSYGNAEDNTNVDRSNSTGNTNTGNTTTGTYATNAFKEDREGVPLYSTSGKLATFGKGFTPMLYDWMNKTNTKYDPKQRPANELVDMGNNSTFLRTADTIGGYRAPNLMDAERMNNAAQAQGLAALQAALSTGNGNRGFAANQIQQQGYNTGMSVGNNYATTQQANNEERYKTDAYNTAIDQFNANARNTSYQDNQKAEQVGQQMALSAKQAANDYLQKENWYADRTNRTAMDNRATNQAAWTDNALNYFITQAQENAERNRQNNDITKRYWSDKDGVMHYIGDSGLNGKIREYFRKNNIDNGTFTGDRLAAFNSIIQNNKAKDVANEKGELWSTVQGLMDDEIAARNKETADADKAKAIETNLIASLHN